MNTKENEDIEKGIEKYKNRIAGIEKDVDPNRINLSPYNFRLHQKPQIETMDGILKEIGFLGAVLVSKKTWNCVDGQMRVMMYRQKGQNVPLVILLDLENEEEERRALLLFDQIGDMARTSRSKLEDIINNTKIEEKHARELVQKIARKKKIDINVNQNNSKMIAEAQKDDGDKEKMQKRFDELIKKWDVENHNVWCFFDKLILIKGDSTLASTKEIIKSYKPDSILTDPPYGIDVVGSDGRIGLAKHYGDVPGDTKPFDPAPILSWNLQSIIWGANHFSSKLPDFPQLLIWYKKGVDNESNDFADAEIAWHSEKGVIRTFDHVWRGAARASERGVARLHPTQKPIKLFEWCIKNFLKKNDKKNPLDLYGGVGTILIAAHLCGTGAISVEKDPRFVAATIERMYNLSKRKLEPEVVS